VLILKKSPTNYGFYTVGMEKQGYREKNHKFLLCPNLQPFAVSYGHIRIPPSITFTSLNPACFRMSAAS